MHSVERNGGGAPRYALLSNIVLIARYGSGPWGSGGLTPRTQAVECDGSGLKFECWLVGV